MDGWYDMLVVANNMWAFHFFSSCFVHQVAARNAIIVTTCERFVLRTGHDLGRRQSSQLQFKAVVSPVDVKLGTGKDGTLLPNIELDPSSRLRMPPLTTLPRDVLYPAPIFDA